MPPISTASRLSIPLAPQLHVTPGLRDRLLAYWWRTRIPGFRQLQRIIGPAGADAGIVTITARSSTLLLRAEGYIDAVTLKEGFYESEVLDSLLNLAHEGATVWDVGANFGLHSATLGILRRDLKIVAFEPNPRDHARLLLHRDWNAPDMQTCTIALSDRRACLPLHLGPVGNSGMTTLTPWSQATYSGTVLVAAARGDELIAGGLVPAPQVIKIDVEGHEAAVLRGLERTLRDPACRAVVLEDGLEENTEPKQLLRSAGFQISILTRNEQTGHAMANFVARKPSSV